MIDEHVENVVRKLEGIEATKWVEIPTPTGEQSWLYKDDYQTKVGKFTFYVSEEDSHMSDYEYHLRVKRGNRFVFEEKTIVKRVGNFGSGEFIRGYEPFSSIKRLYDSIVVRKTTPLIMRKEQKRRRALSKIARALS